MQSLTHAKSGSGCTAMWTHIVHCNAGVLRCGPSVMCACCNETCTPMGGALGKMAMMTAEDLPVAFKHASRQGTCFPMWATPHSNQACVNASISRWLNGWHDLAECSREGFHIGERAIGFEVLLTRPVPRSFSSQEVLAGPYLQIH